MTMKIEIVFFKGNTSDNNTESNNGEEMILFEGDIIISLEELRKYYDINETIETELARIESHASHVSTKQFCGRKFEFLHFLIIGYGY